MTAISSVELWSRTNRALTTWTVSREKETDELGNEHEFIRAQFGDECHRFSPTHSDEELTQRFCEINRQALDELVDQIGLTQVIRQLGGS